MFTGLVAGKGSVRSLRSFSGGLRLEIGHEKSMLEGVSSGASVSISGVCLTVTDVLDGGLLFDVVHNTVSRSTISGFEPGDEVNIELALKVGDKLDGHFVTGHIDGVRPVKRVSAPGGAMELDIETDIADGSFLVPRGSVALDGVSLTVGEVGSSFFRVFIIPATASRTTLGNVKPGTLLNVEFDIMAKYAQKATGGGGVTFEKLKNAGFMD